jgi:hypothetical protein
MGAISKRLHLRDVQIRHTRNNMFALSAKSKRELQSVINFIAHSSSALCGCPLNLLDIKDYNSNFGLKKFKNYQTTLH